MNDCWCTFLRALNLLNIETCNNCIFFFLLLILNDLCCTALKNILANFILFLSVWSLGLSYLSTYNGSFVNFILKLYLKLFSSPFSDTICWSDTWAYVGCLRYSFFFSLSFGTFFLTLIRPWTPAGLQCLLQKQQEGRGGSTLLMGDRFVTDSAATQTFMCRFISFWSWSRFWFRKLRVGPETLHC